MEHWLTNIKGFKKGDWVWCMHCEKVFKWDGKSHNCANCGAGCVVDCFKWGFGENEYPGTNKGQYPEKYPDDYFTKEPLEGREYPANGL